MSILRYFFTVAIGVACVLSTFAARAQLLSAPEGMQFTHTPKFNPEFIQANDILEIRAVMESKKDGDRIRKTHRNLVYQFDEGGQNALIASINTLSKDTAVTAYQLAGKRLVCEVRNDAAGLFSYCYTFNEEGHPLERKYARVDPWKNKRHPDFAARQTKVTTEAYTYARFEDQLHSTLHNSAGRPYQKEIRYYDGHGYLIRYLRSYVMTSERHEEVYSYNEHGWLKSLEVIHGRNPHRMEYTYDGVGNLLTEERHENDKLIAHKEFVYEGSNMLLRAELVREEANQMLYITTYTYTFR